MRFLIVPIFLGVFASACAGQDATLYNSDFQLQTQDELIAGWHHYRLEAGRSGIVAREDQKGGKALLISSPFSERGSGGAYQTIPRTPGQFQRYRISACVRTEGVTGQGAQLYAIGNIGPETGSYTWSEALVGDRGWTTIELVYAAEEALDSLTIGLILRGEGSAWFDNVKLIEVDPPTGPTSSRAVAYIDEFFAKVSPRALDREQINWPELRQRALTYASGARTETDVHSALSIILRRINKHSFLSPPQVNQKGGQGVRSPNIRYANGRRVNNRIAYLNVPNVSGPPSLIVPFADSLQALIRALDSEEMEGWIVDLRENPGGNCWPMLAGLGPLFTGDTLGFFQQRNGSGVQRWRYHDGKSFIENAVQLSLSGPAYTLLNDQPRVAILTGPKNSSSGEVVTVAFRGQPSARSFGQPTSGYSTTNADIPLSDGATVHLTVSVYADRTGKTYGQAIEPDVATEDPIKEAEQWLMVPIQCNALLRTYGSSFGELATTDFGYLDAPLDSIDIVGYGEDTHGTAEFTQLAGGLFLYLVREKGFRSLVIEDTFGAARKMNRFVQGETSEINEVLWDGNWRYFTTEFAELLLRLREYNQLHPKDPVHVYGPEMQYIANDAELLQEYLSEQEESKSIDLGPLTEFGTIWNDRSADQIDEYARLVQQADSLLTARRDAWRSRDSLAYDFARQHLTVMQQYVTAHQQRTWEPKHELREAGMFRNLEWIRAHSPGGKVMYWAHNGHVHDGRVNGDIVATGSRLREQYGDRYYAIGTDFGMGSFLAYAADADQSGWDLEEQYAPPIDSSTLTACWEAWGAPNFFVDFRAARRDSSLKQFVQQSFATMTGAGAQARRATLETELYLMQYDGMIYLQRSSPIHPLEE